MARKARISAEGLVELRNFLAGAESTSAAGRSP